MEEHCLRRRTLAQNQDTVSEEGHWLGKKTLARMRTLVQNWDTVSEKGHWFRMKILAYKEDTGLELGH